VSRLLPGDRMTDAGLPGPNANEAIALSNCKLPHAGKPGNATHAGWCDRHVRGLGFRCRRGSAARGRRVCTRLIRSATPDATLAVVVDPRDDVLIVEASAECETNDVVAPGSFSWHVLTSLADDVQTFQNGREPNATGSVFGITLTARRVAPAGDSASCRRFEFAPNEYADVPDMFRELATFDPDSMEFQRQREKIMERCLPLADHIARRFEGRGEPRDDLVQVARVGLVNAVMRFDVDTGSDFVRSGCPRSWERSAATSVTTAGRSRFPGD